MVEQKCNNKVRTEQQQNTLTMERDSSERMSTVLIEAVASIRDVTATELDPLYETIDPDAIDALCDRSKTENPLEISFQYEGCGVSVSGNGRIELVELEPDF